MGPIQILDGLENLTNLEDLVIVIWSSKVSQKGVEYFCKLLKKLNKLKILKTTLP